MELIRRFSHDHAASGLEAWQWQPGIAAMSPLVFSAFGDAFLQASDGVWFLDTVEGSLTREWDDPSALQSALNTVEGQDRYLMAGLAQAAHAAGMAPTAEEVLQFKIHPVIGGEFDVANIEVVSLVVALQISGQIHDQIRDLPDGTKIAGFNIVD